MWFTYFHLIFNAIHITIPYIWGTQIFQNSRNHLKILDTRKGGEEATFTGGPSNILRHLTKFNTYGKQAPGICDHDVLNTVECRVVVCGGLHP
jgi:hypothetical protein